MRSFVWILFICCLLIGCDFRKSAQTNPPSAEKEATLIVFAAASLTDAFTEIAERFEQSFPRLEVTLHFAGSHQLAQQINYGAPADVFASANQQQMQVVIASGRIEPNSPHSFAHNQLSAVVPVHNPASLNRIQDLAKPGLLIVLADEAVPAGQYVMHFLEKASKTFDASFQENVLANVASYEQNVRAVLTKVALGEADAGIVYRSDLAGNNAVIPIEIPELLILDAEYPVAPLSDSKHPDIAQAFTQFLLSQEGQRILTKHGFITADPV